MHKLWWMRSVLRDAEQGSEGGGGGGGTPAFDPAKFRTDMLADVNKSINGALARLEKLVTKKEPDTKTADSDQTADPAKGDPKADPEVVRLRKQMEAINSRLEESEKKRTEAEARAEAQRRDGIVRDHLGKAGVPADRIDKAMRIVLPDIKRTESGDYVAGDDESPVAEYVTNFVKANDYLLPAMNKSGSGASGNQAGAAGGKRIDINDIKPGMSADDMKAAWAQLQSVT